MHNIDKWPNTLWKSCGALNTNFLKYVWQLFNIIYERVKALSLICYGTGCGYILNFNNDIRTISANLSLELISHVVSLSSMLYLNILWQLYQFLNEAWKTYLAKPVHSFAILRNIFPPVLFTNYTPKKLGFRYPVLLNVTNSYGFCLVGSFI